MVQVEVSYGFFDGDDGDVDGDEKSMVIRVHGV
jgi:hypothetical protein